MDAPNVRLPGRDGKDQGPIRSPPRERLSWSPSYSSLSAYVASKWGLRGLTKAAALDLGRDSIRVVSAHPGGIRTPMTAGLSDAMYASQPIPRIGEVDEVAKLILYLAADATYSTGTEFIIDGGATVGQILSV